MLKSNECLFYNAFIHTIQSATKKDMKVLGTRKEGIWLAYVGVLLMFTIGAIYIISTGDLQSSEFVVLCVFGSIMDLVCICILISYFSQPKEMILLKNAQEILLPGNVVVPLYTITNIRYKRARSRGVSYKYGTIRISTLSEEYVCKFVANCEDVTNQILDLSNKAKENRI